MSNDRPHLLAERGAMLAMLAETLEENLVDRASRKVPLETVEQRIAAAIPPITEVLPGRARA